MYYSSKMAYEVDEREKMAKNGREWLTEYCNEEKALKDWKEIFEC